MSATKIQTFEGNVGIGTNDPGAYRLDINGGTVSATAIEATNLTIGSVTNAFLPTGSIVLWSGSLGSLPSGWQVCDGTNGTPDLRDRFVIGSEGTYTQEDTGGSFSATLQVSNLPVHVHSTPVTSDNPSHNHNATTNSQGSHSHPATVAQSANHAHNADASTPAGGHAHNYNTMNSVGDHAHPGSTNDSGGHGHRAGPRAIHDASNGACGVWSNHPAVNHSIARNPGYATRYENYTSHYGNHYHPATNSNYSGAHNHNAALSGAGDHSHTVTSNNSSDHSHNASLATNNTTHTHTTTIDSGGSHTHSYTTGSTGQGQSFTVTPPYYALSYIMKTS